MTAEAKTNEAKKLAYPIEIVPDEGGFVALHPDLPGCMSSGTTIQEAVEGLNEARNLWIEAMSRAGEDIPQPTDVEDYSGKFVLRIPRSLHRSIDKEARRQGVSLNQYLVYLIAERHSVNALKHELKSAIGDVIGRLDKPKVHHEEWGWPIGPSHSIRVVGAEPRRAYGGRFGSWHRVPSTIIVRPKELRGDKESCH